MTLTTTHIDELLDGCRKGDERAKMKIYNKYYKAMYNTALRIVREPAEAEDIMQECFLKAFDKLDTFEGNSTFGAWLKKIVINQSIGSYNRMVKYQQVSYEDQFQHVTEEDQGFDLREENTKVQWILRSLNDLKDNYRMILNLHLIEGYDQEEICQIMNISYANCRTTLSRAKESLRQKLMPYGNR